MVNSSSTLLGLGLVTDLWDRAYLSLKIDSKTKSLTEDYKKIILEDANSGGNSASELQAYFDAGSLAGVNKCRMSRLESNLNRAVNCVIWAKDFVSSAVSSEPHASLAWAEICVLLPQRDAAVRAIELATDIICRSRIIDNIYITSPQNSGLRDLKKAFEARRIKLYAKILELEARLTGEYLDSEKLSACFEEMKIYFDQVTKQMSILEEQDKALRTTQIEWREMDELRVESQEVSEVLNCISNIPYAEHHNFNREKRIDGTGDWLFGTGKKPQFSQWHDADRSSILWLLGGIRLTEPRSKVIDLLLAPPNKAQYCAYFYCERDGHERSAPIDIVRSIPRQLCQDSAKLCILKPVKDAYDARKRDGFAAGKFTIEECTRLIIAISAIISSITVVIDAVDECDSAKRWELLEFLSKISSNAVSLVKIFLSSRSDENIQSSLPESVNLYLDIEDNRDDIEVFIREKINSVSLTRLPSLLGVPVSKELKKTIFNTLLEQAHGMLVEYHQDSRNLETKIVLGSVG
ncbi:hypothetical protein F5884DRAFT_883657 [Xylogone sp. PMI_703]|nr:hypothetical protein F5884DRAFT_883657 [Xylogone sp. PMI_703]